MSSRRLRCRVGLRFRRVLLNDRYLFVVVVSGPLVRNSSRLTDACRRFPVGGCSVGPFRSAHNLLTLFMCQASWLMDVRGINLNFTPTITIRADHANKNINIKPVLRKKLISKLIRDARHVHVLFSHSYMTGVWWKCVK